MQTTFPTTLALDFGTQRIGVAISRATLAEPLQIVPHNDQALNKICQLVEDHQVQQIVMGMSEAEMADKTRAFTSQLNQALNYSVPIEFTDETLSSVETHHKLKTPAIKKSKRVGHIDHYAAATFLQDWIDTQSA